MVENSNVQSEKMELSIPENYEDIIYDLVETRRAYKKACISLYKNIQKRKLKILNETKVILNTESPNNQKNNFNIQIDLEMPQIYKEEQVKKFQKLEQEVKDLSIVLDQIKNSKTNPIQQTVDL